MDTTQHKAAEPSFFDLSLTSDERSRTAQLLYAIREIIGVTVSLRKLVVGYWCCLS